MSGRPKNPQTWDSGNYSAGTDPWAATPKRVDPGYRFWTPKLKAAGQFLNFFLGDLFDRTNDIYSLAGQTPALNWQPKVTPDATKALKRAAFCDKDQAWYGVGDGGADWGMVSYDYGRTWSALTLGSSLTLIDIACDSSGNVVIIASGSANIYKGTRSSAYGSVTFAIASSALSASPTVGALAYDTTNGKWIACLRSGSTGVKINTSSNGTSWTNQTVPSTWNSYTGSAQFVRVNARTGGTAIAGFFDETASLYRIARSTDGGTTWAASTVPSPSISGAATAVTRPTYDDVSGVWYVAFGTTVGGSQTHILKSTNDGATWTTALYYVAANDMVLQDLSALGTLLVGLNGDGRIIFSTDGAASFQLGGRNVMSAASSLAAGGGGLLALCSADKSAFSSHRFGNLGSTV